MTHPPTSEISELGAPIDMPDTWPPDRDDDDTARELAYYEPEDL